MLRIRADVAADEEHGEGHDGLLHLHRDGEGGTDAEHLHRDGVAVVERISQELAVLLREQRLLLLDCGGRFGAHHFCAGADWKYLR